MTNNNGFTLIEAILVVIILGVIAMMGFMFIADSARTYQLVSAEGKLATEAWVALNRIARELSLADSQSISAPAAPAPPAATTAPTPSAATTSTGGTLTFTTITSNFPAGWNSAANCPNCADNSTSITYTLTGTQIIRNTAANASQVLADGITAFLVTRYRIDRGTVAGLGPAGYVAGSGIVDLENEAATFTLGQANDLLITMTSGASNGNIAHITPSNSLSYVNIFCALGTPNCTSGAWSTTAAKSDTYRLSAHYLTITLTKTDSTSGASVTLTQSVYPNSNFSFPIN